LLGAFYLLPLDNAMRRHVVNGRIHYVRYEDDITMLARTRWHLRPTIRSLNEATASVGFCLHQGSRFVRRIDKGLDFLGY